MYRRKLVYNEIGGGHHTYIWSKLVVWKQDRENSNKPQQITIFGIPICDDPTNQHSQLGIEAGFTTHIPISMVGYTCGFITRYPTDD